MAGSPSATRRTLQLAAQLTAIVVPRQAVGDRDPDAHEANLYDIDAKYGDVLSVDDVLDHLSRFALARA